MKFHIEMTKKHLFKKINIKKTEKKCKQKMEITADKQTIETYNHKLIFSGSWMASFCWANSKNTCHKVQEFVTKKSYF